MSSFLVSKIEGISMNPNFEEGEQIVANKLINNFKRFDVVLAKDWDGDIILKRIIGEPYDHLRFKKGQIILNGRILKEDYLVIGEIWDFEIFLKENEFFLIGDNREQSIFGKFNRKNIIGKVL